MQLSPADKQKLLTRLKRAEGQLAAVHRMIHEDSECVSILTQISAVRGALARAGDVILRNHIDTCVAGAIESGSPTERSAQIDALMLAFARYSER